MMVLNFAKMNAFFSLSFPRNISPAGVEGDVAHGKAGDCRDSHVALIRPRAACSDM